MIVAPQEANFAEGGSGIHKSSQISTPSIRSGIERQQNSKSLPRSVRCPQKVISRVVGAGEKWRAS